MKPINETARKYNARQSYQAAAELRHACHSIASLIYRDRMTHADYLALRQERLYDSRHWARLPAWRQAELTSYLHGLIDGIEITSILWCHHVDGQYVTKDDGVRIDYATIDPYASRHVWRDTRTVWFEPSSGQQ